MPELDLDAIKARHPEGDTSSPTVSLLYSQRSSGCQRDRMEAIDHE